MLKQAVADNVELHISSINVGELFYMLCRKNNLNLATEAIEATLKFPIQVHEPPLNETLHAAKLKAACKLSLADAHAAALTIKLRATLITGDKEFNNIENEENFKVEYL